MLAFLLGIIELCLPCEAMDFELIEEGDHVLSIEDNCRLVNSPESIFITSALFRNLLSRLAANSFVPDQRQSWFEKGVKCRILKLGDSRWIKGRFRIRVSLEFCPDEPEETEQIEFRDEQ